MKSSDIWLRQINLVWFLNPSRSLLSHKPGESQWRNLYCSKKKKRRFFQQRIVTMSSIYIVIFLNNLICPYSYLVYGNKENLYAVANGAISWKCLQSSILPFLCHGHRVFGPFLWHFLFIILTFFIHPQFSFCSFEKFSRQFINLKGFIISHN